MRILISVLSAVLAVRAGTGIPRPPLHFERNVGQAAEDVCYLGRYADGAVLLKSNELVFLSTQGALAMRFPGAGRDATMETSDPMAGASHYFMGSGTSSAAVDVAQYGRVTYRDLYPGISLALRGNRAKLEYDFVVAPHANARAIRLAFNGIEALEVTAVGDLVLHTPNGELRHNRPTAFQEISGRRKAVAVEYQPIGARQVAFVVGGYDHSMPLVIDPTVVWTTAAAQGSISALALDQSGNVYLTGLTPSGRGICATVRVFGSAETFPCNDAFVTKLDSTGTQTLYNTILSGLSEDEAASIAVDGVGNVYILGTTYSADFPVSANAAQIQYAGPPPNGESYVPLSSGGDLFIAKLDASGKLLYSTFLGTSDNEYAGRIRIDTVGNAYVSGRTESSRFPTTPGSYIGSLQFGGGVVAKINTTGTQVAWATYIDSGSKIAAVDLDRAGTAVYAAVGGKVTKLSTDGKSSVYSNLFGQAEDSAADLAVDSRGSAWVVGASRFGVAFIRKVKSDGSGLAFESQNGTGASGAYAVAVDSLDRAFVAGASTNIPVTADALLPTPPAAAPGFVMLLNSDNTVLYASYAPAPIRALAIGRAGQVYATDGKSVTRTDLDIAATATPRVSYLVNAASFLNTGRVTPGEIVTLFGSSLGPSQGVGLKLDSSGQVATSLAGTRVLFNDIAAPLLYVSDRQVNTVVPFEIQAGTAAQVEVVANAQNSAPLSIDVVSSVPEIFTQTSPIGQAAALNQDSTPNSPQNPALQGSIISLFATGGGSLDPVLADGQVCPVPPSLLTLPTEVRFQGVPGDVQFAGSAPGLVAGAIQINVRIPNLPAGVNMDAVNVSLKIGTVGSQSLTTVAVR